MEISSYISESQKKRKRRRTYFVAAAAFAAAYCVLAGGAWIVLGSPLFRRDADVIQGNSQVAASDVLSVLQSSVLRDHGFSQSLLGINNMLIWPGSVGARSLSFLPQVAAIGLSKDYITHTITATVTEREPAGIWCYMPKLDAAGNPTGNESCYWFDAAGTLLTRGFDTEGSSLFAVHDYSGRDPGLGGTILPAEFAGNLMSILDVVRQSGIAVNEIALRDTSLEEIDVTTYNGPDIYFSLRFSADEDLPVLQGIMQKPGFAKLQYIDFRVLNHAYYK